MVVHSKSGAGYEDFLEELKGTAVILIPKGPCMEHLQVFPNMCEFTKLANERGS
jgi:hypothetical protein